MKITQFLIILAWLIYSKSFAQVRKWYVNDTLYYSSKYKNDRIVDSTSLDSSFKYHYYANGNLKKIIKRNVLLNSKWVIENRRDGANKRVSNYYKNNLLYRITSHKIDDTSYYKLYEHWRTEGNVIEKDYSRNFIVKFKNGLAITFCTKPNGVYSMQVLQAIDINYNREYVAKRIQFESAIINSKSDSILMFGNGTSFLIDKSEYAKFDRLNPKSELYIQDEFLKSGERFEKFLEKNACKALLLVNNQDPSAKISIVDSLNYNNHLYECRQEANWFLQDSIYDSVSVYVFKVKMGKTTALHFYWPSLVEANIFQNNRLVTSVDPIPSDNTVNKTEFRLIDKDVVEINSFNMGCGSNLSWRKVPHRTYYAFNELIKGETQINSFHSGSNVGESHYNNYKNTTVSEIFDSFYVVKSYSIKANHPSNDSTLQSICVKNIFTNDSLFFSRSGFYGVIVRYEEETNLTREIVFGLKVDISQKVYWDKLLNHPKKKSPFQIDTLATITEQVFNHKDSLKKVVVKGDLIGKYKSQYWSERAIMYWKKRAGTPLKFKTITFYNKQGIEIEAKCFIDNKLIKHRRHEIKRCVTKGIQTFGD